MEGGRVGMKKHILKNMSPQGVPVIWKDQLKNRCIQRMRKHRRQILQQLRGQSMSETIQGIIKAENANSKGHELTEEKAPKNPDSYYATLDDLMIDGELSYDDYIDIIQCLEDALEEEMQLNEEQLQMEEQLLFEEASLAATIDSMYEEELLALDKSKDYEEGSCPLCKGHNLREGDGGRIVYCSCGFRISLKNDAMGLSYFHDHVKSSQLKHMANCKHEPVFEVQQQFGDVEILYMTCTECGYFNLVV